MDDAPKRGRGRGRGGRGRGRGRARGRGRGKKAIKIIESDEELENNQQQDILHEDVETNVEQNNDSVPPKSIPVTLYLFDK